VFIHINLVQREDLNKPLLNFLGLNSINNRVEKGWYHHIEISNKDMHMAWKAVTSEPVSQGGKENCCTEQENHTDMGATSTQSPESGILGGNLKDSAKYKSIGDDDKHHI
jgi:hypothetical protein